MLAASSLNILSPACTVVIIPVIIPVKVGSGTDPTEGAALAAALLDALGRRALLTLAHHPPRQPQRTWL